MLGKIKGSSRRHQRMRWLDCRESDTTGGLDNNRVCPGVVAEGWLRWFARLLGGVVCRGACAVPCFCSRLFKSAS